MLRRARLVEAEKAGLYVIYRLADPHVGEFFLELRRLAESRLSEVQHVTRQYLEERVLIGDAAACAKKDQKVPQGYHNTELMLRSVGRRGGEIGVCATCMDARGITDTELTDTTHRSTPRSSPIGCSGRIARSCSSEGRRTRG